MGVHGGMVGAAEGQQAVRVVGAGSDAAGLVVDDLGCLLAAVGVLAAATGPGSHDVTSRRERDRFAALRAERGATGQSGALHDAVPKSRRPTSRSGRLLHRTSTAHSTRRVRPLPGSRVTCHSVRSHPR